LLKQQLVLMKNIGFTLLFIAAMAIKANAQIALEGGLVMSNMAIKSGDSKEQTNFKAGGGAGIVVDIRMSDNIYFQPGFFYQTAGTHISSTPNGDYMINTVTVPLNFEYKSGEKCGGRWLLGFGPYIADNLSGTYSIDAYGPSPGGSGPLVIGTDQNANLKALDIGISANAGYQTAKRFYFRVRYQMGIANLYPGANANTSIKSSAIVASIGYLFGSCDTWGHGFGSKGRSHWRGVKKGKYGGKVRNYHKPWLY
jgi:hypothetical protein